jgi:hypothetical protein
MSIQKDDRSLGIGATVTNILTGTPFEFIGRVPTAVLVYSVTDPPGAGDEGKLTMDVLFGTVILAQGAPIFPFLANQGPTRTDHLMVSGVAAPGDRIVVALRSTAAAAVRMRTLIEFRPILG